MSLVTSSAYTETWRTSYFFNTAAGVDTFFDFFAEQQRAMLHPDYSDAEIRLEVRNFGVTQGADGTPAPGGEGHRLQRDGGLDGQRRAGRPGGRRTTPSTARATRSSYNQGGEPAGIRTMTPEDIRRFHAASHHLANMGTVASFPKSARARRPAGALRPGADEGCAQGRRRAPPIRWPSCRRPPATREGALRIYEYPHTNAQQPSPVAVVWPANRDLDAAEQLLAELFFANIAGDASTNLYGLLIDSRSRQPRHRRARGRQQVGEWGGYPVAIELDRRAPGGDERRRPARDPQRGGRGDRSASPPSPTARPS